MEIDACIQSLNKDMNECLDKGEAIHDMAMFLKANAFRKAISEKKTVMVNLDEAIKNWNRILKKSELHITQLFIDIILFHGV